MIPEIMQNELRNRYNPDGSSLRSYQLYLLNMLCDFDNICKEVGVRYWLSQGTVLGAVRHGGFIPWDDDIDVEMLQDDYVKLCDKFMESDEYTLQTIFTDPIYPLPFAKFRDKKSIIEDHENGISGKYKYKGAFIDIFYTEYRYLFISKLLNLFYLTAAKCVVYFEQESRAIKFVKIFKFPGSCCVLIFRKMLKYFPGKTFGLGYGSHFYYVESNESDIFPLKPILFEGKYFPAPSNPDKYLKKFYGDYMKIPDKNTIKTHIDKFFSNI